MVSRLPKFGGRSSTGGASSLPNGSPQSTAPSQDTKTPHPATTPSNGLIRKPSFSLKWRKEASSTPTSPTGPEDVKPQEVKPQTQLSLGKEGKNATPGTPKIRRSGSLLPCVSSPKAIPKHTPKVQSPKTGTMLAQSPIGAPHVTQNGSNSPVCPRPTSGSESRLARPKGTSGLHLSGSQDSLSLSSESLKTISVDNMVRSHSFTHFKQIPSPTSQPMARSFSFSRTVEVAKPLANTNLRPPQTSFLKPPQLSNGKLGLGESHPGGLGGGIQYSRASSAASSSASSLSNNTPTMPTTPTALKKPLLPCGMTTKPLGGSIGGPLGYKLVRPGQTKQQKPLFTGRVKGDTGPAMAPGCGGRSGIHAEDQDTGQINTADLHSDSDYNSTGRGGESGGGGTGRLSYATVAAEALEDMSLSSASSLERGDTSEEFLDDVDSGADTFSDGDPGDGKAGSSTQRRLRNFLNETMDWSSVHAAGCKEDVALQGSKCGLAAPPEGGDVLPRGSSLELSPSNSSGGTYMWDEEGLEALGSVGTHPSDGYDDSELHSMDLGVLPPEGIGAPLREFELLFGFVFGQLWEKALVNVLEPLSTGELDDDDLMLEMDLPEDFLLHHDADRMSTAGRSERAGRQGHWRRKNHWNGPDHFHNDNRGPVFQHYEGPRGQGSFRVQAQQPAGLEEDCTMGAALPDELTLKHMGQDYSSLRNQLLKLQTLLQLEDADTSATAEESEDNTTALQDLQLEELTREGALATPMLSLWQAQHQGSARTGMPQRRQTSSTSAFQPALPPGKTSKSSHHAGAESRRVDRATPSDDELSLLLGTRLHLLDRPGAGSPPRSAARSAGERRPPAEMPQRGSD
ncbi:hypothetical protein NHX12_022491, partial [Muraenolepis orangiensis]